MSTPLTFFLLPHPSSFDFSAWRCVSVASDTGGGAAASKKRRRMKCWMEVGPKQHTKTRTASNHRTLLWDFNRSSRGGICCYRPLLNERRKQKMLMRLGFAETGKRMFYSPTGTIQRYSFEHTTERSPVIVSFRHHHLPLPAWGKGGRSPIRGRWRWR